MCRVPRHHIRLSLSAICTARAILAIERMNQVDGVSILPQGQKQVSPESGYLIVLGAILRALDDTRPLISPPSHYLTLA